MVLPAGARAGATTCATIERIWDVLRAFASFGFCKAHAAAFALPTYQSAWLKAHHTAGFLAGVLTHDPGMYPKRLILDDARQFGVTVLPLDVNASADGLPGRTGRPGRRARRPRPAPVVLVSRRSAASPTTRCSRTPAGTASGSRSPRSRASATPRSTRIVAGQPYRSLTDFWHRAAVSRPVVERLVLAGAFDALHGIDLTLPAGVGASADHPPRPAAAGRRARPVDTRCRRPPVRPEVDRERGGCTRHPARPSRSAPATTGRPVRPAGDDRCRAGRAELDVLGLDASRHVVDFYAPLLRALDVVRSRDLLTCRSRSEILVAGVKVATQTPPIRSGRRVVFVTLDDATGPVDATFFEDAQGPYAATLFHSWLLLIRGEVRRTGPRGVSLRATGCWELSGLYDLWQRRGAAAVHEVLDTPPPGFDAESVVARRTGEDPASGEPEPASGYTAGGMGRRRVLVHPSGFRQSPYADVRPAGDDVNRGAPPRKLWHSSPGSSGG